MIETSPVNKMYGPLLPMRLTSIRTRIAFLEPTSFPLFCKGGLGPLSYQTLNDINVERTYTY
jgi:hypothetical protein